MKRMKRNMRRVTVVFLTLFVLLAGYFSFAVYAYGDRWFSSAYNPRIHQAKAMVTPGDILDRTGKVLAGSDENGNRVYSSDKSLRLAFSHVIGDTGAVVATGVETFHANELLGFNQGIISRVSQAMFSHERKGSDVTLTIDAQLQQYVADIFPSGKDGAVALLNYKTGEIYALYSSPAFDVKKVDEVASGGGSSLVNRATQGQYAPGSIFKVITLAAALDNMSDVESRTFLCEGQRQVGEFLLTDNGGEGHGETTLSQAFNISCNITFGQLGVELGQNTLRRTAERFGFNENFLCRDLTVYSSRFPADSIEQGKLAWTSVGQGDLLVSPLHMAMVAGAIANGGNMMEPRLILPGAGQSISGRLYKNCISGSTASLLKEYMRDVVTDGTGSRASFKGGTVCGKTGTAQTASSGQGIDPHSWFMGFNDDPERPLAIAVVIEHGGSGSGHAAPLAGNVMGKAVKLIWGE